MIGRSFKAFVAVMAMALCAAAAQAANYDESPAGLKKQMEDILGTVRAGEKDKTAAMFKALALPNPGEWFKKVFGDETGARLAGEYEKMLPTLPDELAKLFQRAIERGDVEVEARKLTSADDNEATGLQKSALAAMKQPVPLYTVRFPKGGITVWSFVYVDGSFRLAGKMRSIKPAVAG